MSCLKLIIILALVFVYCNEQLPVRIEPVNVAEVFLDKTSGKTPFFKVGIKNTYEETFDSNPFINGHIKIWLKSDIFLRQLDFHLEDTYPLTVDTQRTAWHYVYWDMNDSDGLKVWKYIICIF